MATEIEDSLSAKANESQFFITVQGQPDCALSVLEYESENLAISQDFTFRINIIGDEIIPPKELIGKKVTLITKRGATEQVVHGIIAGMQYVRHLVDGEEHILIIKSVLTGLNHYRHNRIFINKDIKMIVEEVLLDAGIASSEFTYKTRQQYPQYEYIVQYNETDLAFLQRMIAFHGIFFRFVYEPVKTIITFYDNSDDCPLMSGKSDLEYIVQTGTVRNYETIYSMRLNSTLLTDNVHLKDYNYRTPEADLQNVQRNNSSVVGSGSQYLYGENYLTIDAGDQLSRIQQQSIDWQRKTFLIDTDCRSIEPGLKLTVSNHPDDSRNGDYLIVDVTKQFANQREALLVNFGSKAVEDDGDKTKTFFAQCRIIKVDTPYRTPLLKRPLVQGTFNAVVESTGGEYAYIDEQGRYRIRMGFDIGDAPPGEASHPVRMAQAYTGKDYGIHFPLHDKTEVIVSCINGDINRPIILGTVPNPDNHSPVTLNNNSENIIRTFGGNELLMDDTIDAEKIELFTREKDISLSLDAIKDKHKVSLRTEQGDMQIKAAKTMLVESEDSQFVTSGRDHQIFVENRQRLMTKNKEISQTAKTDIVKKAGDNINWNSNTENTEITVGNDMVVEVENNCSFEVKNKDMTFKISGGKFEIEAAKAITLKGDGGGPISIKQSGAKIEISTAGMIDIEGTTVNIDAGSLVLKGGMMTHVPGGGGGGGGAGGSGGSGSADFTQSEIAPYAGFVFKKETPDETKNTTDAKNETTNAASSSGATNTPSNKKTNEQSENWIKLEYLYSDNTGVAGAQYELIDKITGFQQIGALNANGKVTLILPDNVKSVDVCYFDDPPLTPSNIIMKPQAQSEKVEPGWLDRVGEAYRYVNDLERQAKVWFWGSLKGEYNEDPSVGQIILNTALTLIPIVDQIGDVRDTSKYLKDLIWDKRYAEFAVWAGLILTVIGWIPEVGSLIKGIVKLIGKGGKTVKLDEVFKVFNYFAKGNAGKWLKELLADLPKHQKTVTTKLNDLFSAMIDSLQSVKGKLPSAMTELIKKFDDTIATINKARDQIDTMVGRYFKELKQDLDDVIARFGKSKPDTVTTKKTFSKKQSAVNPNKGLHNQQWDDIVTPKAGEPGAFKTSRKIDMDNLSKNDLAAQESMIQSGIKKPKVQKMILSSGKDFNTKSYKTGDNFYSFGTSGRDFNNGSVFRLDEAGFKDVQSKFYKNGEWDSAGVKNYLALPCKNRANALFNSKVIEKQTAPTSTIGSATEKVAYKKHGNLYPGSKTMTGGGNQIIVDTSKMSKGEKIW